MQKRLCRKCNKMKSQNQFHRFTSQYCKMCRNEALSYKKNAKPITPELRKYIIERDKWICQTCNIKVTDGYDSLDKAQVDHIIPVALGGETEPKNLRLLCKKCNINKSTKIDKQLQLF